VCHGVHVWGSKAFYPVAFPHWELYFVPYESDHVIELIQDSYVVHMWNYMSSDTPVFVGLHQPYDVLARNFCPAVVSTVGIIY